MLAFDNEEPFQEFDVGAHRFGIDAWHNSTHIRSQSGEGRLARNVARQGTDQPCDRLWFMPNIGEALYVGTSNFIDVGPQRLRRFRGIEMRHCRKT